MFTLNATPRYQPGDEQWLRNEVASFAPFWVDGVYGEAMVRTAGPARLVHLEQALSLNGYLLEEVVKAKATMEAPLRG
jgi:hypothetical protein